MGRKTGSRVQRIRLIREIQDADAQRCLSATAAMECLRCREVKDRMRSDAAGFKVHEPRRPAAWMIPCCAGTYGPHRTRASSKAACRSGQMVGDRA